MPYPKKDNFSIGSEILSLKDLHHVKVPAIGGIFKYKGVWSSPLSTCYLPSKNINYTAFKSYLYISNKTICFFSNSS